MKKFMLLPLATLLITTFTAQAETTETTQQNLTQNFSYISGGLQVSTYNRDMYTSQSSSSENTTNNTAGMYLRGSWNFTDNFFVETRGDATVKGDLTISNNVLGLGYFHPINNDFTVYGLAGYSSTEIELGFSKIPLATSIDRSGITGEIGARYQLMSKWTVEPAIRMANYDNTMYEVRLGNNIKVSDHMSIEANLMHRDYRDILELKEMSYQVGVRYSF